MDMTNQLQGLLDGRNYAFLQTLVPEHYHLFYRMYWCYLDSKVAGDDQRNCRLPNVD